MLVAHIGRQNNQPDGAGVAAVNSPREGTRGAQQKQPVLAEMMMFYGGKS